MTDHSPTTDRPEPTTMTHPEQGPVRLIVAIRHSQDGGLWDLLSCGHLHRIRSDEDRRPCPTCLATGPTAGKAKAADPTAEFTAAQDADGLWHAVPK